MLTDMDAGAYHTIVMSCFCSAAKDMNCNDPPAIIIPTHLTNNLRFKISDITAAKRKKLWIIKVEGQHRNRA